MSRGCRFTESSTRQLPMCRRSCCDDHPPWGRHLIRTILSLTKRKFCLPTLIATSMWTRKLQTFIKTWNYILCKIEVIISGCFQSSPMRLSLGCPSKKPCLPSIVFTIIVEISQLHSNVICKAIPKWKKNQQLIALKLDIHLQTHFDNDITK